MNNKKDSGGSLFVQIFPDLPVTGERGLGFEFEGLAKTLAELAQNPENNTPFTVVVRGGWGRGKTTLLRQTQRLLRNAAENKEAIKAGLQREVRAIWFNAWKYPTEDSVLAGLLGTLLDEFRKGDLIDQLKIHVDSHKGTLARMVLHAAAPWAFSKPTDAKGFYGRYGSVEEKRAFNDLFRDLFGQASYLLFHGTAAIKDTSGRKIEDLWNEAAQKKHTLAIFLDDLDRCREERVFEVLEADNPISRQEAASIPPPRARARHTGTAPQGGRHQDLHIGPYLSTSMTSSKACCRAPPARSGHPRGSALAGPRGS